MAKILVLDDEEGMRRVLCKDLSLHGYDVVAVATGEEAIKRIKDGEVFDCALFDVTNYKGKGAIPTMEELKKITPDLKVIVMSDGLHRAVREPRRYGFAESLAKPIIDMQKLIDVINRVLS